MTARITEEQLCELLAEALWQRQADVLERRAFGFHEAPSRMHYLAAGRALTSAVSSALLATVREQAAEIERLTDGLATTACAEMLVRCTLAAAETYKPGGVLIVMQSRNRALGMERPYDLIRSGRGQEVLDWLEGLAAGIQG